jgi:hypothetical protein
LLALPWLAGAVEVGERRAPPEALALPVERYVLPSGLVVLLAPDPTVSSAAVWMSFRAGALYEPPGRSGLAHLVKLAALRGVTPAELQRVARAAPSGARPVDRLRGRHGRRPRRAGVRPHRPARRALALTGPGLTR